MFFLGLSCRGAFVFAERLRVIDSSLLFLMVYVRANTVVLLDCFFSISDDDMYHANSD